MKRLILDEKAKEKLKNKTKFVKGSSFMLFPDDGSKHPESKSKMTVTGGFTDVEKNMKAFNDNTTFNKPVDGKASDGASSPAGASDAGASSGGDGGAAGGAGGAGGI